MSVQSQISRIQTSRNKIRTKLVSLGLVESAANLDTCADAVAGIENQGNVSAQVAEGDTYTIPRGFHTGSGTVSGVAGGGNYTLESKTVTPTKSQISVTPDSGYYGLSDVTVNAIPEAYQDVTSVTATAEDVFANKIFVTSSGAVTAGTMTNNGSISKNLDTTTTSYTVPKGYHSGSGKVSITLETKSATPTKNEQTITPTAGSVLSSVTVNPIPATYADTSDATAAAAHILAPKTAYITDKSSGSAVATKVTGTMADNGDVSSTFDGLTSSSATIPAGYTSGGTISLTDDIEQALSEI